MLLAPLVGTGPGETVGLLVGRGPLGTVSSHPLDGASPRPLGMDVWGSGLFGTEVAGPGPLGTDVAGPGPLGIDEAGPGPSGTGVAGLRLLLGTGVAGPGPLETEVAGPGSLGLDAGVLLPLGMATSLAPLVGTGPDGMVGLPVGRGPLGMVSSHPSDDVAPGPLGTDV